MAKCLGIKDVNGVTKTDSFAPAPHSHAQSDITDLSTALAGKANSTHTHASNDISAYNQTGNQTTLTAVLSQIYGLITGKANSNHTHSTSESWLSTIVNSLQTIANKVTAWSTTTSHDKYPSEKLVKDSLDAKANTSHTHAQSDITGLQTIINNFSYRLAALESGLCTIKFINSSGTEVTAGANNLPIFCAVDSSHLSYNTTTQKFTLTGSSIQNPNNASKSVTISIKTEHLESDPGISSGETTSTATITVAANTTVNNIEIECTDWREWATAYPEKTPTSFQITNIVTN